MAFFRTSNGGGGADNLVMLIRGENSSRLQTFLHNKLINRYKYMKLMTAQEYQAYSGTSALNGVITITSVELQNALNNTGTFLNLSTTDVSISNLSLSSSDITVFVKENLSGRQAFVLQLHN